MSQKVNDSERISRDVAERNRLTEMATGRARAELVLKHATYVNVFSNELCTGDIACGGGKIVGIGEYEGETEIDMTGKIVCPGMIDAHIHLESSLVAPAEFAKAVVRYGTTCVVTDPHEITNVMGTDGIDYMLQATENLPVDVRFMVPSCVPATPLDESGAELDWRAIDGYLDHARVLGLAEMMNAFGVVHGDPEPVSKIAAAFAHGKIVDGHAPGLEGGELNAYACAGVYSDHECSTMEDALRKLRLGQYIMIRDGTAARNLEALAGLLCPQYGERCMFCTDDKHPSDLINKGHIDDLIRQAINRYGADPILAVRAATLHPARYFGLDGLGAIAPGYRADLIVIDNFENFHVERVYREGVCRFEDGRVKPFKKPCVDAGLAEKAVNTFHLRALTAADFEDAGRRAVIGMVPGEIVSTNNGFAEHVDPEKDILTLAVVERHHNTGHIGLGYLQGYGLKEGAVATSISHDSHNLIVVGTNAADMALAANHVAENHGGIAVVKNGKITGDLRLEIAGLMSDTPLGEVNRMLEEAKEAARSQGVSEGIDPFMTLSFMSLPVIPALRLTTRGMVDVINQKYIY